MSIECLSTGKMADWHKFVQQHPQETLWQSPQWKAYREAAGQETRVYVAKEGETITAAALVIMDRTVMGLSTWDIPRGPLWNNDASAKVLLEKITEDAKADGAYSLYFSPINHSEFRIHNSQFSSRHEQPEATRILDITKTEEEILAQMKQKGRYNIRLAEKHGVRIEQSDTVAAYATLATETAKRDGFTGHSQAFYERFLYSLQGAFLLLGYAPSTSHQNTNHQPAIAGLLGVVHGTTGMYYYGASDYAHRALMAPFLLQWKAIQYCKEQGCTQYDLLGVAPPSQPNHPWSGITDFKDKFGGALVTYPPEQEIVLKPLAKSLLGLKRRILG